MKKYITVPVFDFETVSCPTTIKIADIKSRRFNIIDRKYEASIETIIDAMKLEQDLRNYIYTYVKRQKKFDNLRAAIKQHCPENEILLDKMLALK